MRIGDLSKEERLSLVESYGITKEQLKAIAKENGRSWKDLTKEEVENYATEIKAFSSPSYVTADFLEKDTDLPSEKIECAEPAVDSFEKELLDKITSGDKLSERELRELSYYSISDSYGENRRWSRTVESVCELCGRYFLLTWEEGLTEMQENEFYDQPVEVEQKTYEKTITVTEWVPVSEKEEELEDEEEYE